MPIQKVCENCGQPFAVRPRDAGQRFCKRACQTEHEGRHGRVAARKQAVPFTCKNCGQPFTMKLSYLTALRKKWGRDPLYCSMPCSDAGRRADSEARAAQTQRCIQCDGPITELRKPSGHLRRGHNLCSAKCRSLFRRLSYQAKHPDAQPTRRAYKNGYFRVVVPGKDGEPSREEFEHRYVMEQHLGRRLRRGETVHHKDGNRANNAIENLELFVNRHGPGQRPQDRMEEALKLIREYPDLAKAHGIALPHE